MDTRTKAVTFNPGDIANDLPFRVGNKTDKADWHDQHFGANDCSVFLIGPDAKAEAQAATRNC